MYHFLLYSGVDNSLLLLYTPVIFKLAETKLFVIVSHLFILWRYNVQEQVF